LFINDLPDWMKSNIRMFADDTKIWTRIKSATDMQILQTDLDSLSLWTNEWLLRFNPPKCKVMHIGHQISSAYTITQDNTVWKIQEVQEEKDLGIVTTADLKVSKQCMEASARANRVLGMVRRQFRRLDKEGFLIIYKGFIRPHLKYAIQAWSPYLKGDVDQLERVQKCATKMVYGYQKLSYEKRLRRLGLTTLQTRRLRGDLIETYKIITGKENVDPTFFFTLHSGKYNTRGHPYKLEIKRSRLELRRNFYSQRVVHHWNHLPEHVVMADTVNSFKIRLDKEWGTISSP